MAAKFKKAAPHLLPFLEILMSSEDKDFDEATIAESVITIPERSRRRDSSISTCETLTFKPIEFPSITDSDFFGQIDLERNFSSRSLFYWPCLLIGFMLILFGTAIAIANLIYHF